MVKLEDLIDKVLENSKNRFWSVKFLETFENLIDKLLEWQNVAWFDIAKVNEKALLIIESTRNQTLWVWV